MNDNDYMNMNNDTQDYSGMLPDLEAAEASADQALEDLLPDLDTASAPAEEAYSGSFTEPVSQPDPGEYHYSRPDAGRSFDVNTTSSGGYTTYTREYPEGKSTPAFESPYTSSYSHDFTPYDQTPVKEKKKEKKERRNRHGFWTVFAAAVLALACGFGGAWMYEKFFGSGTTVIYQTVTGNTPAANPTPEVVSGTTSALSLADVVERCKPSVVEISVEVITSNGFWGTERGTAAGSGVIISSDGYIVTNYHVIEGAQSVTVTTALGLRYSATVYGYDKENDLALIKVDADDLTPVVIADSDSVRVGETAFAIGNPLGTLGGSVTSGIVSALDREITVEGQKMRLMQVDASVNPGNSGGGLFNTNGELIGIVNAKSIGEDVEGIGFAIPSSIVKDIIAAIMESGGSVTTPSGPVLGITIVDIQDEETAKQYRVSRLGVYIIEVTEGMGAAEAGLQASDYIVSIDDVAIETSSDLTGYLSECEVGQTVTIQIIRNNRMMSFEVKLMERTA